MAGRTQRAFTLIELSVVIVLIAILAGIGYGTIIANRNSDQGRVAANLIADVIRQARHTALSSGAPVEVRIHQDSGAWVIDGVSQLPLWSEQFEGNTSTSRIPPVSGDAAGFAGQGLRITSSPTSIPLPAKPALVRNADDSLYLECSIYARPISGSGEILALAVTDAADTVLIAVDLVTVGGGPTPRWTGRGEVGGTTLTAGGTWAVMGGEWIRVGVKCADGKAELYVDGHLVGSATASLTLPFKLPLRVDIGASGTVQSTIDNCRLYRLGASSRIRLPRPLAPQQEYRLQALPDGTITGDTAIVVEGSGGKRTRVKIDVFPYGKVSYTIEDGD